MTGLFLNAIYDGVNKAVGPTLVWIFVILMFVELVYVMAKYLTPGDKE